MEEHTQNSLGDLYVGILKAREASSVSQLDAGALLAVQDALKLIERLALYGAATNACLDMLSRRMEATVAKGGPVGDSVKAEAGGVLALRSDVLSKVFEEETKFVNEFERMVRMHMCAQLGIDPNSAEALLALPVLVPGIPPVKTENN